MVKRKSTDNKMVKRKSTDNTMDKRNKGRIDEQPFIKHYGTQVTDDQATRTKGEGWNHVLRQGRKFLFHM
jgi:hypothetical protein